MKIGSDKSDTNRRIVFPSFVGVTMSLQSLDVRQTLLHNSPVDILPALTREDSPKGIFRLRVSSGFKHAFA